MSLNIAWVCDGCDCPATGHPVSYPPTGWTVAHVAKNNGLTPTDTHYCPECWAKMATALKEQEK